MDDQKNSILDYSSKLIKKIEHLLKIDDSIKYKSSQSNWSNSLTNKDIIRTVFIGSIDGIEIHFVNGDDIKKKCSNFSGGCNFTIYQFVPNNQIWIDSSEGFSNFSNLLFKQLLMIYLIRDCKLSFDDAQTIINSN